MTVAIDIEKAKEAKEGLEKYHKDLIEICEGLESVLCEIDPDEGEAIDDLSFDLKRRIYDLEDNIYRLKMMTDALERIIMIWERTEKKNIAKVEESGYDTGIIPGILRIEDIIPGVVYRLFR